MGAIHLSNTCTGQKSCGNMHDDRERVQCYSDRSLHWFAGKIRWLSRDEIFFLKRHELCQPTDDLMGNCWHLLVVLRSLSSVLTLILS